MEMHTQNRERGNVNRPGPGKTIGRWVFAGFLLVAAYFLLTEHRAHLFGVLPFLLLAACPLMHFFHHHGHGDGHHHDDDNAAPDKKPDAASHRDH